MTFRNYDKNDIVKEQYKKMRSNQTFYYANKMKTHNLKRLKYSGFQMNVLDAINKLNEFVDASDPDTNIPNMYHFYQTAEKIRTDGLPEWFQLVGLIHDLGKMMFLFGNDDDGTTDKTQWGIVGDTYILGCSLRNKHVYPEFDNLCNDMYNEHYNTNLGIYSLNCGLSSCVFTWGHDEYLYDVLQYNKEIGNVSDELPEIAYLIIRYHSLYPWHKYNEYEDIESNDDIVTKQYVQLFNKYDLYTKTDDFSENIDVLNEYYSKLIFKFVPNGYLIF